MPHKGAISLLDITDDKQHASYGIATTYLNDSNSRVVNENGASLRALEIGHIRDM